MHINNAYQSGRSQPAYYDYVQGQKINYMAQILEMHPRTHQDITMKLLTQDKIT